MAANDPRQLLERGCDDSFRFFTPLELETSTNYEFIHCSIMLKIVLNRYWQRFTTNQYIGPAEIVKPQIKIRRILEHRYCPIYRPTPYLKVNWQF